MRPGCFLAKCALSAHSRSEAVRLACLGFAQAGLEKGVFSIGRLDANGSRFGLSPHSISWEGGRYV
jgi:hypothetical protein